MCTNALPSRARRRASASRQPLRMREAPGDFAIAIDLAEVVGARHQRVVIGRPWLVLPASTSFTCLRRRRELLEVVDRLVVGREFVIRAGAKSEHRFWCREAGR